MKSITVLWLVLASLIVGLAACEDYTDEFDDSLWSEDEDRYGRTTAAGTYQAEDYSFQSGCGKATAHAGYTGSGFVDFGGNGTLLEWNNINAPSAGQYTLVFRYGNGSGGNRQCAITVNDTTNAGNVTFGKTGAWTTWSVTSIKVTLKQGRNKIRVTANTSSGGPNLDKMDLMFEGATGLGGQCAVVNENSTANLSCPSGQIIQSVTFASYGTPTGSCPSFSTSSCHASTSKSKVEALCLNKAACSVGAKNGVFGDPCPGTYKKLAVSYTCGSGSPNPSGQALKVFVLAGQSNMVGQGTVNPTQAHLDKNGGQGTLKYLTTNAGTKSTYAHLVSSSGGWASRSDVWLVDLDASGPLTIAKETFGPEVQLGHVIGNYYQEPVLIIKTSWGGKSLYADFRPPSSGGTVGPYYEIMVDRIHEVLDDIRKFYPSYDGQGYEIVGFGWHQGWNDRINSAAVAEYQTNCVNLINDLRRELKAPKMRFVLATTGMSGWTESHPRALGLMEAQMAVPNDGRLVNGYAAAVETRDFWRDQSISPADQGYHWNRNAETYFLIGNGMGQAMLNLIKMP
jgi:alpha-galactosidase